MNDKIYLQFLGPSPFHADFYIKSSKGPDIDLSIKINHSPGYDTVEMTILNDLIETEHGIDNIRDFILEDYAKELGIFYNIVAFRNEFSENTSDLESSMDAITEKLFQKRVLFWGGHLKSIKEMIVSALLLEVEAIERAGFFFHAASKFRTARKFIFFQYVLERRN